MKLNLTPDYSKYEPIGDRVLLILPQTDVNEMVNQNGILVPKDAALRSTPMRRSVVIAAGPDCKQVRVGDEVFWNVNNSSPFPEGTEDLYFLPEQHLICITARAPRRCTADEISASSPMA